MNLPNRLTIARFFLTAVFVIVMSLGHKYSHTAGLILFAIASLTDYLDGYLARRYKLVTNFGKLMDPLADKILTASAFVLLVASDELPAWLVILIIGREFLVTGLRLLAVGQGYVLAADKLGKHKTAWQIVTIVYFLLLASIEEWAGIRVPRGFEVAAENIGVALSAIAAALTVYSGLIYLKSNWTLMKE